MIAASKGSDMRQIFSSTAFGFVMAAASVTVLSGMTTLADIASADASATHVSDGSWIPIGLATVICGVVAGASIKATNYMRDLKDAIKDLRDDVDELRKVINKQ